MLAKHWVLPAARARPAACQHARHADRPNHGHNAAPRPGHRRRVPASQRQAAIPAEVREHRGAYTLLSNVRRNRYLAAAFAVCGLGAGSNRHFVTTARTGSELIVSR
jgi:hypothetical protein